MYIEFVSSACARSQHNDTPPFDVQQTNIAKDRSLKPFQDTRKV